MVDCNTDEAFSPKFFAKGEIQRLELFCSGALRKLRFKYDSSVLMENDEIWLSPTQPVRILELDPGIFIDFGSRYLTGDETGKSALIRPPLRQQSA